MHSDDILNLLLAESDADGEYMRVFDNRIRVQQGRIIENTRPGHYRLILGLLCPC